MIQVQKCLGNGRSAGGCIQAGWFEQELCRLLALNEIGGPLPPRELRYRPVIHLARTAAEAQPRKQTWKDRWWRCFWTPPEV